MTENGLQGKLAIVQTKDIHSSSSTASSFAVTEAESGQKLLQLLERRLHLAPTLLHRWIRTGQIRRNGARCKPFERTGAGDLIRLPPFAWKMSVQSTFSRETRTLPLPAIVARHGHLLVMVKPAGLPTHPGTNHTDSLSERLKAHYQDAPFVPVPCHRLDKDTSGLLLVATTFEALRQVHQVIREGLLLKEYLCWVAGAWPRLSVTRLSDRLAKCDSARGERMQCTQAEGKEAVSLVFPLTVEAEKSLLLVRILTGRTHQIRVQLAHIGYPVLGDRKYGDGGGSSHLLLHACRLRLADGFVCTDLPLWPVPYAVTNMPELSVLDDLAADISAQ